MRQAGVPEERFQLDLAIARGLDYYTGTIYETFLHDLPGIGSVCSGGRYDDLAKLFTKQSLPGVGRFAWPRPPGGGHGRAWAVCKRPALRHKCSVVLFAPSRIGEYCGLARRLRARGIWAWKFFRSQRKSANNCNMPRNGSYRVGLIAGPDEFAQGRLEGKRLWPSRTETTVARRVRVADAVTRIVGLAGKDE